jgi:methylated-DNA-[protein]-cysteine S-methyltransferase
MTQTFSNKVYGLTKKIPKGKVSTYKLIAEALHTRAYRAVGQALRRNPHAPHVPCHRVVGSDSGVCGFQGQTSGPSIKRKIALLKKEGVQVKNGKIVGFRGKVHRF